MYLLDTNVVSELRKAKSSKADANVMEWAASIPPLSLFLSCISMLELDLPAFAGRILAVDVAVAQRCAKLHVPDRRSDRDALIAATALTHGLTVVTRNIADFESTGVLIVDPWQKA